MNNENDLWFCRGNKILAMTRDDAELMMNMLPDGASWSRDDLYWDEDDVEDIKSACFVWKQPTDSEFHGNWHNEPCTMQEILDFGLSMTEDDEEFLVQKAYVDEDCTEPWA